MVHPANSFMAQRERLKQSTRTRYRHKVIVTVEPSRLSKVKGHDKIKGHSAKFKSTHIHIYE